MGLSTSDKAKLAEKLIDLANLLFTGSVLGQAFVVRQLNYWLLAVGSSLFIGFWVLAIWILREKGR